ncbi:MAG: cobalt transporter [Thiotrichaceae bacterium]|nr:MAG: cobalt transporter [Thiotrichaceae bacterium]
MNTVNEVKNTIALIGTGAIPWATVYAVTAAVIVGVLIIGTVGFAGPEILHNAAHDVRHGLSFPCH